MFWYSPDESEEGGRTRDVTPRDVTPPDVTTPDVTTPDVTTLDFTVVAGRSGPAAAAEVPQWRNPLGHYRRDSAPGPPRPADAWQATTADVDDDGWRVPPWLKDDRRPAAPRDVRSMWPGRRAGDGGSVTSYERSSPGRRTWTGAQRARWDAPENTMAGTGEAVAAGTWRPSRPAPAARRQSKDIHSADENYTGVNDEVLQRHWKLEMAAEGDEAGEEAVWDSGRETDDKQPLPERGTRPWETDQPTADGNRYPWPVNEQVSQPAGKCHLFKTSMA